MKQLLLLIPFICICFSAVVAETNTSCTNASTLPLKQQYLCKRFVTIAKALEQDIDQDLYIDMKDVLAVKWDRSSMSWLVYTKGGGTITVKSSNGTSDTVGAFRSYQQFLLNHPEFLGVP